MRHANTLPECQNDVQKTSKKRTCRVANTIHLQRRLKNVSKKILQTLWSGPKSEATTCLGLPEDPGFTTTGLVLVSLIVVLPFFFLVLQMGHMSLVRKSSFFGYARNGVIFFSLKNAEPFFSQKRRLEVSRSFFLNASILVKSTTLADIFTNLSTKLVRN